MVGSVQAIQSIQNRFLRITSFIRQPHSTYRPLLTFLNIEPLDTRRIRLDLYFISEFVGKNIYCSSLLAKLNFSIINRNTR